MVATKTAIPDEITQDADLNNAISALPANYNFEIHKTIHQIRKFGSTRVALQFPEGLLMYACSIADIIERFTPAESVIMGDVTYGACCVDDFTARALGCDFMVHYGHSCLVPIDATKIRMLYVFVEIAIDANHLADTIRANFDPGTSIALLGTVQFVAALHAARALLTTHDVTIPQTRPLSPGEVLGCTSPRIVAKSAVFVGDGRFHLESAMIHSPETQFFQYDPYTRRITREAYSHSEMIRARKSAIAAASQCKEPWGLILGTLGRQGAPGVLASIGETLARNRVPHVTILLSEIFPSKLARMDGIGVFVQTSCPRLSIDWGEHFARPLLTPYEAHVALDAAQWQAAYPMDYYAYESLGRWTPNHGKAVRRPRRRVMVEHTV